MLHLPSTWNRDPQGIDLDPGLLEFDLVSGGAQPELLNGGMYGIIAAPINNCGDVPSPEIYILGSQKWCLLDSD